MSFNNMVSIGMPVFNGANLIGNAINSLLAQSYANFELIISDNASTDDTESICLEFVKLDKRIKYFRQKENIGSINNFKFVLAKSTGVYFMWAPHDDSWDPNFLFNLKSVLDTNKHVGLVAPLIVRKDLISGNTFDSSVGFIKSDNKLYKLLFRLIQGEPNITLGLHRREVLIKFDLKSFDYYDIHMCHWYELNSHIYIIPLSLYSAGAYGIRIPYSLTGKYLSYKEYLKRTWKLLLQHIPLFSSIVLFILFWYLIRKNTNNLNAIIRENTK